MALRFFTFGMEAEKLLHGSQALFFWVCFLLFHVCFLWVFSGFTLGMGFLEKSKVCLTVLQTGLPKKSYNAVTLRDSVFKKNQVVTVENKS